jgi:hypothetical protein
VGYQFGGFLGIGGREGLVLRIEAQGFGDLREDDRRCGQAEEGEGGVGRIEVGGKLAVRLTPAEVRDSPGSAPPDLPRPVPRRPDRLPRGRAAAVDRAESPRPLIGGMKVAIVGAGIGGPAPAQGLLKAGFDVGVYERDPSPSYRKQGYRIHISPIGEEALAAVLPAGVRRRVIDTATIRGISSPGSTRG